MSDEEKKQEETPEQKEDEKWSKEKQRADQAEASYRKLSVERDDVYSQLTERDDKITSLEKKMADLAESKDIPVEDLLDPDLVDPKTIKTVSSMARQIKEQKKAIDKLTKLADDFQKQSKDRDAKTAREETIEKILKPLDEEFGAKFRNQARKLADKLVDEGKEKQPADVIDAMIYMRKCYKTVVKEAEEKEAKKKPVQTDSGSATVAFDGIAPKSGSRREILADIKKKGLTLFGKTA